MEVLVEVLNTALNFAKGGELDACKLVDELKKTVQLLLVQLHEDIVLEVLNRFVRETIVLKSKLQNLKQEKLHAIENEKIVASEIESLSEKKRKLMRELETARCESENN
ncbi:hypothetical protein IEQ34_022298 [Dendrobium chrysotoxum]|uniref:Uncharacterized protein n=1 Tax=Dendrobium chrysotoxum TaxID=161865 RepID=A0AAV7FYF4_DENCH|nr:hypothetical protein IEQ34_022298 [Dendrobium chrysotoxum]